MYDHKQSSPDRVDEASSSITRGGGACDTMVHSQRKRHMFAEVPPILLECMGLTKSKELKR